MNYYEVYVASQRFHGKGALTYTSSDALKPGQVIIVPLQREKVLAIVVRGVKKPAFATKSILDVLETPPLPSTSLSLLAWLSTYYPAPAGMLTQLFIPHSLLQKSRKPGVAAHPTKEVSLPPLTSEQTVAFKTITSTPHRSYLVHGETGTGKTRLYLELVRDSLSKNKSALVLTPEIGLTPQLVTQFENSFPGSVIAIHSNLTPAERRNTWRSINESSKPLVVIGPRSALFSPLHNLGYIIVDEAHDTAYKQEQAPYYLATRVAAQLAALHDGKLILGSATPLISDYYLFEAKGRPIIRMRQSAVSENTQDATIAIVDLRDKGSFSKSPFFSDQLLSSVTQSIQNNEQSLLFLNRRGTARLVLCQNCEWQALCPRCDLPLTYHSDNHLLNCHTCGHKQAVPSACPNCKSTDIVFKSIGTKTLVNEVERLFPKAKIQRFDSDSSRSERLEHNFESVKSGDVDIIVGTQMLSKGIDLPRLSTVGVVVADTSLYFPDYSADERTFQLLRQVIGRVGRGHTSGRVIIQTYQPDNPTIKFAATRNYEEFYRSQIKEREQFDFPPFYHFMKLSIARSTSKGAENAAAKLYESLQSARGVEVSAPAPAFTEKINNKYRWHIIVKSRSRRSLTSRIDTLPAGWIYDLDPSNLL